MPTHILTRHALLGCEDHATGPGTRIHVHLDKIIWELLDFERSKELRWWTLARRVNTEISVDIHPNREDVYVSSAARHLCPWNLDQTDAIPFNHCF